MQITFGPDLGYFMQSFLLGIILAFLYDIIKTFRRILHSGDIAINIQDIIFTVISGILIIALSYLKNNGRLRVYSIITAAAAFGIYRLVIKNRFVNLTASVYSVAAKGVFAAVKIVAYPFKLICTHMLYPLISAIKSLIKRTVDRPHKFRAKRKS